MKTILISGGTGLVGRVLCTKLLEKGYSVRLLSTSKQKTDGLTVFYWNIENKEIDQKAFENINYIIHLAGANVSEERWSLERKKLIIDSRVISAQLILQTLQQCNHKIEGFISASAVGYYGAVTTEKIFTETDSAANDFVGETCRQWEQAADQFNSAGIRTVKIRTGVLLAKKNGALAKMITPVKFGIGSALASGKQYMPWIHIDDLCAIYIKAIEDQNMNGAYNAVAPDHKTNKEVMHTIATISNKPFWFPNVPVFVLKLLFGEMADIFVYGSRVSSSKLIASGFIFKFSTLKSALLDLIKR